jgi:hypothetical protein
MTQTERRATIARFLRSVVPISADEAMGLAECVAPDVPCDCTTLRDRLAEVKRERDYALREFAAHNCVCDDPPRCPVFDERDALQAALQKVDEAFSNAAKERDEHEAKRAEFASEARSLRVQLEEARRDRGRADLDADARCTARVSGVAEGG